MIKLEKTLSDQKKFRANLLLDQVIQSLIILRIKGWIFAYYSNLVLIDKIISNQQNFF